MKFYGNKILRKYPSQCYNLFEDLIRAEYCGEYFKETPNGLEIKESRSKGRYAILHRTGQFTGWFKDFKGGKSLNLVSFLVERKGYSYKEACQYIGEQLRLENDSEVYYDGGDFIDAKRGQKQTNTDALETKKQEAIQAQQEKQDCFIKIDNTPAELYLKNTRGFAHLPQFIKDAIQYNVTTNAISFPITNFQGQIISRQSIKLTPDGKKNGQKLMDKGGIFSYGWHADNNSQIVIIGEGVETTIALANAIACYEEETGIHANAFDYMARMGTRENELHPRHKMVILLLDNDAKNSPAYKQAKQFEKNLKKDGRIVVAMQAVGQQENDKQDFADMKVKDVYNLFRMFIDGFLSETKIDKLTTKTVTQARKELKHHLNHILETGENALFRVDMGIGKTTYAKEAIIQYAKQGKKICIAFPTFDLIKEKLPKLQFQASLENLKVRVLEGRRENENCENMIDVKRFVENHNPVMEFCNIECPKRHACKISTSGYLYKLKQCEDYDILVTTQTRLQQSLPDDLPKPNVIFIDELGDGEQFVAKVTLTDTDFKLALSRYKEFLGYNPNIDKAKRVMHTAVISIIHMLQRKDQIGLNSHDITQAVIREFKEILFDSLEPFKNEIARLEGLKTYAQERLPTANKGKRAKLRDRIENIEKQLSQQAEQIDKLEQEYNAYNETNIVETLRNILKKMRRSLKRTLEYQFQFGGIFKVLYAWEQIVSIIEAHLKDKEKNKYTLYREDIDVYTLQYTKGIHSSWGNGQRIILDATPSGDYKSILKEHKEIIIKARKDHLKVTQYVGCGYSKTAIDTAIKEYQEANQSHISIIDMAKNDRNKTNIKKILFDLYASIEGYDHKDIGIITTKSLEKVLKDQNTPFPKDIDMLHWGNIRGKNVFKDKKKIIIYGMLLPPAEHFVRNYEVETGQYCRDRGFTIEQTFINDIKGNPMLVYNTTHSNKDIAQKIHNYTNSEVMQAIERIRSVNATEDIEVEIYGNVLIDNIPINTIHKGGKNTFILDQRYTDKLTGGGEGIIFEGKNTASKFYQNRIKTPQAYKAVNIEQEKDIENLVKQGWTAYGLTYGVKRKTKTRFLLPPAWSIEQAEEYIVATLGHDIIGEIDIEAIDIVFNIEAKQNESTSIYNKILELFINTCGKTRNRVLHVCEDVKSYLTERKTSWIDRAKEWLSIGKYNYVSV